MHALSRKRKTKRKINWSGKCELPFYYRKTLRFWLVLLRSLSLSLFLSCLFACSIFSFASADERILSFICCYFAHFHSLRTIQYRQPFFVFEFSTIFFARSFQSRYPMQCMCDFQFQLVIFLLFFDRRKFEADKFGVGERGWRDVFRELIPSTKHCNIDIAWEQATERKWERERARQKRHG